MKGRNTGLTSDNAETKETEMQSKLMHIFLELSPDALNAVFSLISVDKGYLDCSTILNRLILL